MLAFSSLSSRNKSSLLCFKSLLKYNLFSLEVGVSVSVPVLSFFSVTNTDMMDLLGFVIMRQLIHEIYEVLQWGKGTTREEMVRATANKEGKHESQSET